MSLPQQILDLRFGNPHRLVGFDLDQYVRNRLAVYLTGTPHEPKLRRRDRDKDNIVLVLPRAGLPLLSQHSDDIKRHAGDPNLTANRIASSEELLCDGL